jgi:predicted alpha/beta superfamily hydrolase
MRVRVHYPLDAGELRLRSDLDWERDLVAAKVDRQRRRFEFELDDALPFRYFKPVLATSSETRWSRGENFLALRERRRPLDVFPYFSEDSSCHVCTLLEVPSSYEERGYDVRVFLPPGYDENELQRFPVLYMQDGQNLFFPGEAPRGKHWRVAETLALLERMSLVRQVIVVGVYPRERMQEYTQPGYETYGRFMARELKPYIDSRYRTLADPEATAVMGSSLGGVVSFYLGWQYPEVFGQVGALSSTFGYQDDLLARVLSEPCRRIRVYLDSGWPRDNYEATRSMATALRRRGLCEGKDLLYLAHPEARHEEEAWAARCHVPFQFFFRG